MREATKAKMETCSRLGRSPISLLGSSTFAIGASSSTENARVFRACGNRYRCWSVGTRRLCAGDVKASLEFICGKFCFFFFALTRVQATRTAPPGGHGRVPGLKGLCVSQDRLCVSPLLGISITPPDRMHESKQLGPEEQQQQQQELSMFPVMSKKHLEALI